jgi:hypothetical protein
VAYYISPIRLNGKSKEAMDSAFSSKSTWLWLYLLNRLRNLT